MIPPLLLLALDYYRDPHRFPELANPLAPLPAGISELLGATGTVLAEDQIEATAGSLNASIDECHSAVPFFVKQVLLGSESDFYRTLGVQQDAEASLIKTHYRYLIRLFHPDRNIGDGSWDELYAHRINEAYATLRNAGKRREYDLGLVPPSDDGFGPGHAAVVDLVTPTPGAPRGRPHAPRSAVRKRAPLSPRAKVVVGVALIAVFAGLAIVLLVPPRAPALRVESARVAQEAGEPGGKVQDLAAAGAETARRYEASGGNAASVRREKSEVDDGKIAADFTAPVPTPRLSDTAQVPGQATEDIVSSRVDKVVVSTVGAVPLSEEVAEVPALVVTKADAPGSRSVSAEPKPASRRFTLSTKSTPLETRAAQLVEVEPTQRKQEGAQQLAAEVRGVGNNLGNVDYPAAGMGGAAGDVEAGSGAAQLVVSNPITSEQLFQLIGNLIESYESADIYRFVSLFADNAQTSDASGQAAIFEVYKPFFEQPVRRKMEISRFSWQSDSDSTRTGTGEIRVATIPLDGGEPTAIEGTLTLGVSRFQAGLKIVAMYHVAQNN